MHNKTKILIDPNLNIQVPQMAMAVLFVELQWREQILTDITIIDINID